MTNGSGPGSTFSCRLSLQGWRREPSLDFPPPYEAIGEALRHAGARLPLETNPVPLRRLAEGAALRVARGDDPADLEAWMRAFARRTGLPVS